MTDPHLPPPHASAAHPPHRYGRGMLRQFGWFYYLFGLNFLLRRIRIGKHSAARVMHTSSSGVPVYILLRHSLLDALALNTVLNRRRLPLSVWSNGPAMFFWQPVLEAWRDLFFRLRSRWSYGKAPDPVTSGWLCDTLKRREPITIFLEAPFQGLEAPADPLGAVLKAAEAGLPVKLLPVICVWNRAPDAHESAALTFLRGSHERPSALARVLRLLWPGQSPPLVQIGEPLDLSELITRTAQGQRVERTRTLLRRYLTRESRVVRGPALLPKRVMEELVLTAPPIRSLAARTAQAEGVKLEVVEARLHKEFQKIAADFRFQVIQFLSIVMRPIWTRVYTGYDIPEDDLDKIRSALRHGSVVIAPTHKSHFDYLLMSWILYWADLIVPHIIAGVNLALPGVHRLLRASGAFFIERSFHGKPLHAAVFARYLRELLLHGYIVEFFVEGGRTRTGRLLPPKLGVLDMILDAAHHAPEGQDVTILPVIIFYEQIAEERAYQKEQGGQSKRGERVGDLIRARSVLFRRFGRIFVRVGEPIDCKAVLGEASLSPEQKRERVHLAGERLIWGIGQASVLLPTNLTALVLLVSRKINVSTDLLFERTKRFVTLYTHKGIEVGPLLAQSPKTALLAALQRFESAGHLATLKDGGEQSLRINQNRRTAIAFHMNQITHHLTPAALVASSLLTWGEAPIDPQPLIEDFGRFRQLLHRELVFRPAATDAELVAEGLEDLVIFGALRFENGAHIVADTLCLREMHGSIGALIETWRITCHLVQTWTKPPKDKTAAAKLLHDAEAPMLAQGIAARPEAFGAVSLRHAIDQLAEDKLVTFSPTGFEVDRPAIAALEAWLDARTLENPARGEPDAH